MGFYELIKSFDAFGAQINFYLKSKKNYKTFFGGLALILYAILCPIYILINFISFKNRTNISVIHYSKEIFATEELVFKDKTSSFAVGLTCDKYNNTYGKLEDLFDLQFNYISRKKMNGTSIKKKYTLPLHKCTYDDFHENLKNELDVNEIINNFYCPNERNHTIKGIITDESFNFYELILVSNNDSKKDIYKNLINRYDCKFNLYFTDVSVDVTNVNHPITYYLNNLFIQLASVYFKKVDAFFNFKSFKDDENLLFNKPKKNKFLTFVRTEQYDIYRGEDRFETKYEDYRKFAKYFIKADKTRTIIERKCQKFSEFVASVASILSAIFLALHLVIDWINYSFAMKNIIDTLCEEQKNLLQKLILLKKTLIQGQQFNNEQDSGFVGKLVDSKIKISPYFPFTTLEELNKKSIEIKSNNNANNYCISFKRKNLINVNNEVNTNEKIEIESQLGGKKNNKNISKLKKIKPFKCIEVKDRLKINDQIKSNNIDCYEAKFKTRKKISIINYIIKKSIIKFYLCKIFTFCRKKQKKDNNNYEIFMDNFLEQLIKRLDIINYLKKSNELETLFQMIFKPSDFNLFSNFAKFNLNSLFTQNGNFHIFDCCSEQKYTDKFKNNYNQLLNNPIKTILEERLENLIQKEMNEL